MKENLVKMQIHFVETANCFCSLYIHMRNPDICGPCIGLLYTTQSQVNNPCFAWTTFGYISSILLTAPKRVALTNKWLRSYRRTWSEWMPYPRTFTISHGAKSARHYQLASSSYDHQARNTNAEKATLATEFHETKTSKACLYTNGLVQERHNSSPLAKSYVLLALTHWYKDVLFTTTRNYVD